MAEEVPASELRYAVGILASLDSLDGPAFDEHRLHPLAPYLHEHAGWAERKPRAGFLEMAMGPRAPTVSVTAN